MLLDMGADVNGVGTASRTALHEAVIQGHLEVRASLIGRELCHGGTRLNTHSNLLQVVRLLLAEGADCSLRDETGASPLDEARRVGR